MKMNSLQMSGFKVVLDLIRNIHEFNGENPSELPDFFSQVENILPSLDQFDNSHKQMLFSYLKNKCVGKCREALHSESPITTWPDIRRILKKHFGEKRNVNDLMDELKTLTLRGTIETYYRKINKIVSKINNRRLTHDETMYSTEEIRRIALKTFKDNVPEPTKTMLFARNPEDLEKAYEIILDAKHQYITQFGTVKPNFSENKNLNYSQYKNNSNNFNNNNYNYNRYNNNNSGNFRINKDHRNNNSGNFRPYNNNNNNNHNYNNNYNRSHNNNSGNFRNNNYRNNNDTYNNQRANSGNTRQTNRNNSQNVRQNQNNQNRNGVEPMEIGQIDSDFQPTASNFYLT